MSLNRNQIAFVEAAEGLFGVGAVLTRDGIEHVCEEKGLSYPYWFVTKSDYRAGRGQYKLPYVAGQMPTPYYDANDGFPGYLLRNDGHGNFTDATAASGLASKRFRRSYSASFVDLDEDGDVDLVVVSDESEPGVFAFGRVPDDFVERSLDDIHPATCPDPPLGSLRVHIREWLKSRVRSQFTR
mgnify:CR=1 FL=1